MIDEGTIAGQIVTRLRAYVSVEPFHLFRYLDEQAFRFNERTAKDGARFNGVLAGITGKRIMFKELIGKSDEQPAAL